MKRRSFWFVMLVAVVGISFIGGSLSGCGSTRGQKGETAPPPPPIAKVVPPETKVELPVAPASVIKKEVPPPLPLPPAPAKKKKG